MAIDKRHYQPGCQDSHLVLIVAFVLSGIGLGATSLVSLFQSSGSAGTTTGDPSVR